MLGLLFSLMVWANELPVLQGEFIAQKEFQLQSHHSLEDVETKTSAGFSHLTNLKNEGFQCSEIREDFHRCFRKNLNPKASEALISFVQEKWAGQALSFYEQLSPAKMNLNTDFQKAWSLEQKVVFWEVPFETVGHVWIPVSYVWTQGVWSVHLGHTQAEIYFPLKIKNKLLSLSQQIDLKNGNRTERFMVQVQFQKRGN